MLWAVDYRQRGLKKNITHKQKGGSLKQYHPHYSWDTFPFCTTATRGEQAILVVGKIHLTGGWMSPGDAAN
jgi:hypothetical protein